MSDYHSLTYYAKRHNTSSRYLRLFVLKNKDMFPELRYVPMQVKHVPPHWELPDTDSIRARLETLIASYQKPHHRSKVGTWYAKSTEPLRDSSTYADLAGGLDDTRYVLSGINIDWEDA